MNDEVMPKNMYSEKTLSTILRISSILNSAQTLHKKFFINNALEIQANGGPILSLSLAGISSVLPNLIEKLGYYKSPLTNEMRDLNKFQKVIDKMSEQHSFIRLNHFGFCYKVESIEAERIELSNNLKKTSLNLYEEWSDSNSAWFFVGNIADNWQNPLLELIPIVHTEDIWKDYWVPHVQFDIDTTLSEEELRSVITSIFGAEVKPHPTVIDGITYALRVWLGCVNGVNIYVDFATNNRQVQYHREKLLKKI